jgi:hypothetical protein
VAILLQVPKAVKAGVLLPKNNPFVPPCNKCIEAKIPQSKKKHKLHNKDPMVSHMHQIIEDQKYQLVSEAPNPIGAVSLNSNCFITSSPELKKLLKERPFSRTQTGKSNQERKYTKANIFLSTVLVKVI